MLCVCNICIFYKKGVGRSIVRVFSTDPCRVSAGIKVMDSELSEPSMLS